MRRSRIEAALSSESANMLDYCVDMLGISKSDVVRLGIREICSIVEAIYSETFKNSRAENYSEAFDFQFEEHDHNPFLASTAAAEYADSVATEDALSAVKRFFELHS